MNKDNLNVYNSWEEDGVFDQSKNNFFLECLNLEYGTDILSGNVDN